MGRQNKVVDKHIWKDIWKLIEQDVSTAVATYMIVAVYCVVCAQSYGGQIDRNDDICYVDCGMPAA